MRILLLLSVYVCSAKLYRIYILNVVANKVLACSNGLVVSAIDKHSVLRTWSLEALVTPIPDDMPEKDKRRMMGVIHKVAYARDVLAKIRAHEMPDHPRPVPQHVERKEGPRTRSTTVVEARPIR